MILRIETERGQVDIELNQNGTAKVTRDGRSLGIARWHQKDQYQLELFALPRHTFEPEPAPEPPEPPGLHFRFRNA